MSDEVIAKITGFGAETTAFVHGHPPESGKPDMQISVGFGILRMYHKHSGVYTQG